MRKKFLGLAIITVLFSACGKDDDNGGTNSANSWTLSGTTYSAASVAYQTSGGTAGLSATATGFTATSLNSLAFTFFTIPTNGQQFTVTTSLGTSAVVISAIKMVNSVTTSYSNKATTIKSTTTINNGKVSINVPSSVWLYNNSNANDSLQLSATTITQTL